MAGSERSSRGPRKVPLPMSASLGSCSVAQPGSSCRGFARALPRAPLRGTRRPRRRPTSPDCCRGNVAPSSTATSAGCPPGRMYELAEDSRTAAGHAVAVCEPAGAEDAVGKRHSDRRHHPSSRPGRRRPDHYRDDHQHFGPPTVGFFPRADVRRGTAAGTELRGDSELQSWIWKRQRDHALARRVADADRCLQPGRSRRPCHQRFGMEQAEDRHRHRDVPGPGAADPLTSVRWR